MDCCAMIISVHNVVGLQALKKIKALDFKAAMLSDKSHLRSISIIIYYDDVA